MQPLEAGEPTVIGPYRLLGRLGAGGMGRVYLGRSAGGRTVAVKVVHPHFALDEEFRARFRREVEAARRVGGAWTAPVLDADPEASVPWVATGYVAGPPLSRAVGERGVLPALPEPAVRVLGAGLAESLTAVHGLGLVHRDVKPSNVLLTLDGPRLIDFGIARATEGTASLTSSGVSIGSPGYMAPEQILGKGVTGAADVFSLGAVLVYAATGDAPFAGDSSAALLYKVVHEEPELALPDGDLRTLVAECLAKDPAARPTPDEVARRLAPDGAASLAVTGWLPGLLVEQVSRSAVSLLDLETAQPEQGSGLVEFSSPSVGDSAYPDSAYPGSARVDSAGPDASTGGAASLSKAPGSRAPGSAAPASGAGGEGGAVGTGGPQSPPPPGVPGFGPPDPTYADPPYADPPYAEAAAHEATATSTPAPRGAVPSQRGRLALSVDAGSVPGAGGKGRRMSCTVALAVAGALAAVTLGSVFLPGLLPGGDADNGAQRPPGAGEQTPGRDQGTGKPDADKPGDGVPRAFLGTWEGKAEAMDGLLPSGTVRVVVEQARPGEQFGTASMTDELGLSTCTDILVLKKATADEIVATGKAKVKGDARCTENDHPVRLTRVGDDLTYVSENPDGGSPEARLSKRQ